MNLYLDISWECPINGVPLADQKVQVVYELSHLQEMRV